MSNWRVLGGGGGGMGRAPARRWVRCFVDEVFERELLFFDVWSFERLIWEKDGEAAMLANA